MNLKFLQELFPTTFQKSKQAADLIETNKKLTRLSKFIKLFKEIKAQPQEAKDELQLEFDRDVLKALTAMYLSQREGMSEEEIVKSDSELIKLFQLDLDAEGAHD